MSETIDYFANPGQMPRPYVQFEVRPTEQRQSDGTSIYKDEIWVKVTALGGKDALEKLATEWIAGIKAHADAGRVPASWPGEYTAALESFRQGQELPVHGTPIKTWPALSPAQRRAVLGTNILTVEDLAAANDEAKSRIGMGAEALVQSAKAWVENANGPGALAARLQAEIVKNEDLARKVEELTKAVASLKTSPEPSTPKPSVSLKG